jgi:lipopolysaccharide transport system permease protein
MQVKELWAYRELLFQLVRREVLARHRHSILGVGWALLQPLGMMLLFTFVFNKAIPQDFINEVGAPYPLWLYLGILPWTMFSTGLTNCVNSLTAHRSLVTKIYFPQQILPITGVASALFDFCVASIVLLGLATYFHFTSDWSFVFHPAMLLLPFIIGLQLLLMIGFGLWLGLANLWYRDVKYLFGAGIQMWMFLTNVLYPLNPDASTTMKILTYANPMVPLISSYRAIVVHGQLPAMAPLVTTLIIAAVSVGSGWALYRAMEGRFAERV